MDKFKGKTAVIFLSTTVGRNSKAWTVQGGAGIENLQ
jgi:hypothetical protein